MLIPFERVSLCDHHLELVSSAMIESIKENPEKYRFLIRDNFSTANYTTPDFDPFYAYGLQWPQPCVHVIVCVANNSKSDTNNNTSHEKFKKNRHGITFEDLMKRGIALHKRQAQDTLKYYRRKPQEYFATTIRSEVIKSTSLKFTPINPTGVTNNYSSHLSSSPPPLSKCLDELLAAKPWSSFARICDGFICFYPLIVSFSPSVMGYDEDLEMRCSHVKSVDLFFKSGLALP